MSDVNVVLPKEDYFNKFVGECVTAGASVHSTEGVTLPTTERLHPLRRMYLRRDLRIVQLSDVVCIWPTPKKFGQAPTNEWGDHQHLPGWVTNLGKELVRLDKILRKQIQ